MLVSFHVLVITSSFGIDFNMALEPYGPTWRHLCREFWANFCPTNLKAYELL